jgi:hypothetical protein
MRRAFALAAVAVVAALAPACSRGGGDDDGFRLVVDGGAVVEGSDVDAGDHTVHAGDEIQLTEGTAVLELPGDRSLLLRAGVDDRDDSVVVAGDEPEIVAGDAVVIAGDETTFRVGDVDARVRDGSARVQRSLSVTIAVYEGAAEVRAAGREFDGGLPALRQLSVPATGVLPREAVPLVYDEVDTDPWDLRFIGDAIDLGARIDRKEIGFQLAPSARADTALLERVLPPLAGSGRNVADLSPWEALVGGAIAVEAGGVDRWDAVFSFRGAGAKWGLVALDQRVTRDALLGRIDDAIRRAPLLFAAVGGGTQEVAGGPTTTAPSSSPSSPRPPVTTPPDDGGPTTPTTPTPTTPTLPPVVPQLGDLPLPGPLAPPDDDGPPDDVGSSNDPPSPPTVTDAIVDVVEDTTELVDEVVDDVVDGLLPNAGGLFHAPYDRANGHPGERRHRGAQGLPAQLPWLRPG